MTEKKDTAAPNIWDELRKPFPKESIGLLPKPYKKDSPKSNCQVCGTYHGLPAVHLDYVGHALVTDRLNSVVGPEDWNWAPYAVDEAGLPRLDRNGGLWIKLTVHGVTKPGYGDGSNSMKELIGDALRNAAMRFGVALDLWSKAELESNLLSPVKAERPAVGSAPAPATPLQIRNIVDLMRQQEILDDDMASILVDNFDVVNPHKMTEAEANRVLEGLKVAA